MTRTEAEQRLYDPLWFGAMLVKDGKADLYLAGNLTPTSKLLRVGMQCFGMAAGIRTVSSFFLMIAPDMQRMSAYADCMIVPRGDCRYGSC